MIMRKSYLGPICLTLAAGIWGGVYVVSKALLALLPALELIWIRYLVALISLVIAGFVSGQSWRIRRQDIPLVCAIGGIGYFLSIWAQFVGTHLSSAQMGAVITSATPAFMVIFARFILQEKITLRKSLSVLMATVGVLLIVGVGDMNASFQLGGFILLIAALTWALMSVLVKKVPPHYSQLVITTYAILVATILMTPLAAPQVTAEHLELLRQPALWGGVLYMGVIGTAGAFFLWNKGLQLVDAASSGLYFFFQPLVGALLGWFFLGEQVGLTFWLGSLLIAAGVFLVIKES